MPEYVNLGRSGLLVSRLGLGSFNFGNTAVGCDEATSLAIIRRYLDAGHNYIDTANVYGDGRAEQVIGTAVRGRRHSVVIASKAGAPVGAGPFDSGSSRKALLKAVEDSLGRLETDYVDLYQMHVYDPRTPLEETLSTLNDLVRQGKVRYLGFSNWTASEVTDAVRVSEARGWEPVIAFQPQYNILLRDIEVEITPTCLKFGIGIVPWSPLAGGLLSGIYRRGETPPATGRLAAFPDLVSRVTPRSWDIIELVQEEARKLGTSPVALSLAWLMRRPGVVAPLVGPETVQQLEENLAALDLDVPPETLERIDAASRPVVGYPHNFGRRSGRPA